jgi:hypothetical protein
MDETFTFVAPVMPRREYDPFLVRLVAAGVAFLVFVIAFGGFVVHHEHVADRRAADARARLEAQAEARAAELTAALLDPADVADRPVRDLATRAANRALDAFAHTASFATAGPAQLSRLDPAIVFVDGPSTSPAIASVVATDTQWAAAVTGASGACYWVRATTTGEVYYGTGPECTGTAALAASGPAW